MVKVKRTRKVKTGPNSYRTESYMKELGVGETEDKKNGNVGPYTTTNTTNQAQKTKIIEDQIKAKGLAPLTPERRAAAGLLPGTQFQEGVQNLGVFDNQATEPLQTAPEAQIAPVTPVEQGVKDQSFFENVKNALEGRPIEIGGKEYNTGLRGSLADEQAGLSPEILGGSVPIGIPAQAIPAAFKVGEEVIANPTKVVQAGNAIKNSKAVAPVIEGLKKYGLLIAGFVGFSVKGILDKTPEQQQALNTLGTITSTIVGDSTTAAGDYKKGLAELNNIKQQLLNVEADIKSGSIRSPVIKYDGTIIDLNADVYDQLATIDEGIRDIQSFAIEGNFPEMTPFEIQQELRKLEEAGIIEPVDLTTSRRQTSF